MLVCHEFDNTTEKKPELVNSIAEPKLSDK